MDVVVECHSGHTYAERPRAFYQDHTRFEVETIHAEWQSPECKHFRVKTKNGSIFELTYEQARNNWQIRQT